MIDRLYKYSSDRKQFTVIPAKSVSVSVDALTIHSSLWQAKRPSTSKRKWSRFPLAHRIQRCFLIGYWLIFQSLKLLFCEWAGLLIFYWSTWLLLSYWLISCRAPIGHCAVTQAELKKAEVGGAWCFIDRVNECVLGLRHHSVLLFF